MNNLKISLILFCLVLSDTYYPGWKVFVDGKIDNIYRADYVLRAVYLTKGKHFIKFIYAPLSFKIGCYTAFATLISVLFSIGIIKLLQLKCRKNV